MDKNTQTDMVLKHWVFELVETTSVQFGPDRQPVINYIMGQTPPVPVNSLYLLELINTAFDYVWSVHTRKDDVLSSKCPALKIPGLDHMSPEESNPIKDFIFGGINCPERFKAFIEYNKLDSIHPKNEAGQYQLKFLMIDGRTSGWSEIHLVSDNLYEITLAGYYIINMYNPEQLSQAGIGLIYKHPASETSIKDFIVRFGFTSCQLISYPDHA